MLSPSDKPASLKHELRTPLNHILGYCELLIEEAQDRSLQVMLPDLQRIHEAGRRLLAVINDLFDSSRAPDAAATDSMLHHELRTPLNQIIGYAEMLQEEAAELGQETLAPDLQQIHSAARELLRLVVERVIPARQSLGASPAESAAGATTFLRRDAPGPAQAAKPGRVRPALTGTVLVVDDDEANRTMLARRLTRLGHNVALAENGRKALEAIGATPFDLVLLDIQMPEMNGYEVLERLKSDPAQRDIPVIVLSASDDTERVAHCVALGAEDYLPKPFDAALLQARLGACLEKKRLRDREVSYLQQIQEEKQRSEELLHIILPHDVAEELKATQTVRPRRFENVGVLFCDIVGFTAWCEQHRPEEVLRHLQELVEAFEMLATEHELEKIKTIGDSFMATAGLLEPAEHPALNCVKCGLAMIATARALPSSWQVRVGVHVGPVIAGVVGRRKYQYDVWGDTVNTAARMEECAEPGTLCVNGETWQMLEPHCRGCLQARVEVRGKGSQDIFRVEEVI